MKRTSPLFFILYFAAVPMQAQVPARAQAQQSWSLKECIAYGLRNNRNTAIYANDKKAAEAQSREALAAYLPSFNVTASLDDNLKLQESDIPAGILGPKDIRIALTQKYNTQTMAEVDQTIYDQSLLTGLKANKYNIHQADLNIRENEETIIYNISTAFYQIDVYREQLTLLTINLQTYEQQMTISALKVRKGVAIQSDLDKVTVNYNNTRSQISVAESNLILSQNQLKNAMGYSLDSALTIGQTDSSATNQMRPQSDSSSFLAINRTDYQLARVQADLLEINQEKIRAGALPRLTAYARYGAVGFGSSLAPAVNVLSPYSAVGIKLTIPLFDFYKRNAQYNEAKYKQLDAMENLRLDAGNFRLEYENARTQLQRSQSDMENNRRNIELARSVFRSTDLQYQKGVTDLTDWINAQHSLKEAEDNYLNSLYNFYTSGIALEKSKGTLRKFYNAL
jgi:outer membrane protein